ncbi:hypothetical protein PR202_gb11887 [Eleusine coracana subsp. coracana]|uniref:Uncharacterized protein n=1 Tax=Eleusine coracana subsp. coracana TaxID=191504 RepID=A0AAV5ELD5_ELECO|nr:hypothetical protein PR202_gb11887 [Eleusine coracana subsp. coracana]
MKNRLENFIPRQQHHLCLDVAVRKPKSPCRHDTKVVDDVAAAIIFIDAAMERPNPPFILDETGEKKEEINSQCRKLDMEKNLNPNLRLDLNNRMTELKRRVDPHSSPPVWTPEEEGDQMAVAAKRWRQRL